MILFALGIDENLKVHEEPIWMQLDQMDAAHIYKKLVLFNARAY